EQVHCSMAVSVDKPGDQHVLMQMNMMVSGKLLQRLLVGQDGVDAGATDGHSVVFQYQVRRLHRHNPPGMQNTVYLLFGLRLHVKPSLSMSARGRRCRQGPEL